MTMPLGPEFIDSLADALADRLADVLRKRGEAAEVVDATTLATRLGVSPQWVRDHAEELGGWRLGDGPKAHYRFDAGSAEQALRGAIRQASIEPARPPDSPRSRTANPDLLPVRGPDPTALPPK